MTVEELEMHKGNALFCLRQFHQESTLKVVEKLFIDAIGKAELKEKSTEKVEGEEECEVNLTD